MLFYLSGLDVSDFFLTKASRELDDVIEATFCRQNLSEIVTFRRQRINDASRSILFDVATKLMQEKRRTKSIVAEIRENVDDLKLSEGDALLSVTFKWFIMVFIQTMLS